MKNRFVQRKKSKQGEASQTMAKPGLTSRKVMLCVKDMRVWCGVVWCVCVCVCMCVWVMGLEKNCSLQAAAARSND